MNKIEKEVWSNFLDWIAYGMLFALLVTIAVVAVYVGTTIHN